MSVLLSKGSQTLESSEQGGQRKEKVDFLRLKAGESARVVFIPDSEDRSVFASAEYLNHRDWPAVKSHPCLSPVGECYSCEKGVPKSRRFLIAFHLLDEDKDVTLDVSRKQYNAIKTAVADYVEDGSIFEMAFKLSKTGTGTESSFSIAPILKLKADEKAKVAAVAEKALDEDFFENALRPRTNEQLREMLKDYGTATDDEVTPIDEGEDDPTKNF